MNSTKQARRLLKLADIVEQYEDNFAMESWIHTADYGDLSSVRHTMEIFQVDTVGELAQKRDKHQVATCGMTACLGGWAVLTWPKEAKPGDNIEDAARRILGYDTAFDLDGLFDPAADWQTAHEAAAELRRRAIVLIEGMD